MKADPVLANIITSYNGEEGFQSRGDAFQTMLRSIVGQQISVKAAACVWGRFCSAVGQITPADILNTPEEALRTAGLSRQKVGYVYAIAQFQQQGYFKNKHWQKEGPELINHLTQIPGVGVWTAKMFMMFHLQKPNVLPLEDLGLRNAIKKSYNGGAELSLKEMQKIAQPWAPYNSVATWYLWRSLDNE